MSDNLNEFRENLKNRHLVFVADEPSYDYLKGFRDGVMQADSFFDDNSEPDTLVGSGNSQDYTLHTYAKELCEYMENILAECNVPKSSIMEIAEFATMKAQVHSFDEIRQLHRAYVKQMKKGRPKRYERNTE